jgi:hypothetical protein
VWWCAIKKRCDSKERWGDCVGDRELAIAYGVSRVTEFRKSDLSFDLIIVSGSLLREFPVRFGEFVKYAEGLIVGGVFEDYYLKFRDARKKQEGDKTPDYEKEGPVRKRPRSE